MKLIALTACGLAMLVLAGCPANVDTEGDATLSFTFNNLSDEPISLWQGAESDLTSDTLVAAQGSRVSETVLSSIAVGDGQTTTVEAHAARNGTIIATVTLDTVHVVGKVTTSLVVTWDGQKLGITAFDAGRTP